MGDVDVKTPKADVDVDLDGKTKGGFDINMPDISLPNFGFGGKGKKPDGSVDVHADVSVPAVDANVDVKTPTAPSVDANVDIPSADIDAKAKGGFKFGQKGSKKKKKDK